MYIIYIANVAIYSKSSVFNFYFSATYEEYNKGITIQKILCSPTGVKHTKMLSKKSTILNVS